MSVLLLSAIVFSAFMCCALMLIMLGYVVTLEPSASVSFCFF